MANQPLTEGQRLFTAFLFGFGGSLLANFIVKQIQSPVASEELPPSQFESDPEDEQSGGL